jgi:hypothetical protein
MSSLPKVLHEAASRSASEIIIESGHPPLIRTSAGAMSVGEAVTQSDLFDALAQVLAPEQQAELAVGNVVEFNMDVESGRWTMITEPSGDGIIVRGRLRGGPASVEMGRPLDLPALEPVEPERTDRAPRAPNPMFRRTSRRTRADLGVGAAVAEEPREPDPTERETQTTPAPDSIRFDERPTPLTDVEPDFELRTPTGEQPANLVDAHEPEPGFEAHAEPVTDVVAPLRDVPAPRRVAPPEIKPANAAEAFELYGRSIQPGTLCIVQGEGNGEELAQYLDGGLFIVIDDPNPDGDLRLAADSPLGSTFVVRVEDPSACLGWMLRRLEEGARVVLETRARSLAGARRILLGVGAGPRAEDWLDAHAVCWLADGGDGWTLQSD